MLTFAVSTNGTTELSTLLFISESFSFTVPFSNVNYIEETAKDTEALNTKPEESVINGKSQENSQIHVVATASESKIEASKHQPMTENILNVPERIRKRNLEEQTKQSKRSKEKQKSLASKMLELEAKGK